MTRLVPSICALIFALFHVLTVVATLVSTGGSGEGQGMLVVVLDLPLVLLVQVLPGGHLLHSSRGAYILFYSVAGTGMYAAAGYGFGILLRALGRIARHGLDPWLGLHAPAVALANAALPQSAGDAVSVIAVALIALVYVAAIGAAFGWLAVAVRCWRAGRAAA